jgi:hypothetical protein
MHPRTTSYTAGRGGTGDVRNVPFLPSSVVATRCLIRASDTTQSQGRRDRPPSADPGRSRSQAFESVLTRRRPATTRRLVVGRCADRRPDGDSASSPLTSTVMPVRSGVGHAAARHSVLSLRAAVRCGHGPRMRPVRLRQRRRRGLDGCVTPPSPSLAPRPLRRQRECEERQVWRGRARRPAPASSGHPPTERSVGVLSIDSSTSRTERAGRHPPGASRTRRLALCRCKCGTCRVRPVRTDLCRLWRRQRSVRCRRSVRRSRPTECPERCRYRRWKVAARCGRRATTTIHVVDGSHRAGSTLTLPGAAAATHQPRTSG